MQEDHKTVGGLKDQGLFSLLHISCGHVEFERMMILQERPRTLFEESNRVGALLNDQ